MSEPNEEIRLAVLRGRADERERIIKLLEEQPCLYGGNCCKPCFIHELAGNFIALIKGEQK